MWKRLRDMIINFFTFEVEEMVEVEETQNHTHKNENPLKTKVTFQYPSKKTFRFPVIPDNKTQAEQAATTDVPAYQRRNKELIKTNQSSLHTNQRHVRKRHDSNETKKTFQPSRVASPIYGYQERKRENDIKNIPAYIRKREQVIEHAESNDSKLIHTELDNQSEGESPSSTSNIHESLKKESLDKPTEVKWSGNKQKEQPSTQTQPNPKQRAKKRKITSRHHSTENIPYNVMMTPKDKRKFAERKNKNNEMRTKVTQTHVNQPSNLPPDHLLNDPVRQSNQGKRWMRNQQQLLEQTLKHFNVDAKVVHATQGPSVTRFEVQPALGVKVSRVRNLSDDIKLNMAAKDIRIEAPIPGKNTIGIEVPNLNPQMVGLQEVFAARKFKESSSPLTIGLGLTIEGEPLITNISKMPHGLIAGATGSGKSVCINTILISLIYKSHYDDVKFLLIDPKMVELSPYNDIPHLVAPVITDIKAATASLKWAVDEMEDRYERFVKEGVRDIERYNEKIKEQHHTDEKMPFIVIVIDELADLMMMAPQDVEDAICRIAQKARACGIHLLIATQRPSVDVITGLIKANIPTRIAFSVSSQVDSRTIIDANGAEKLLGKGDMLFIENGSRSSIRLQGAFVSDEEIERVTSYARSMGPPNYLFEQAQLLEQIAVEEEEDDLLDDVIQFIFEQNSASTSLLQRNFRIGYNRAARLIDTLENKGLISEQNGSKPRDVLISKGQYEEMLQ